MMVGRRIDPMMKDPAGPLWLAATVDNALPDVWGSAYLVSLNLSTPTRQQAAMSAMVRDQGTYFHSGQVRSLPFPEVWTRCDFSPAGQGCKDSACSRCVPNGKMFVPTAPLGLGLNLTLCPK